MSDEEEFYKTLPFTISPDQANPDFVILGTGLQECLIAAHSSKLHSKRGLVIDTDKTYGSCLKTLTFKELHRLNIGKTQESLYTFVPTSYQQRNINFYTTMMQNKAFRGYNIDIEPNFFFGASSTCDLLREADMDKYMDFRLVQNMLHYDGKTFKNVPLSKGKIFETKDLGLLEKKLLLNTFHSLTQIYNKYKAVAEDHNSTKEFDKEFGTVDEKLYSEFESALGQPFIGFLSKLAKGNSKIIDYIAYIICNYQYFVGKAGEQRPVPEFLEKEYTVAGFICRFGKFLKSCGIYGEGPYLYVDNGIGDVPQSYSRIASIYGATYILHPKITLEIVQVKQDETGKEIVRIKSNLYPEGTIETQKVYYGPTFYQAKFKDQKEEFLTERSLRVLLLCSKLGTEQECPSIAYLLNNPAFANPVYLFMFDSSSHSCPNGFILYQFETVLPAEEILGQSAQAEVEKKIQSLVGLLLDCRGEGFGESIKYVAAYIRQKRHPKGSSNVKPDLNRAEIVLRDHNGIDLDSHFSNFIQIVGQSEHYFKKEENVEEEEWRADEQTMNLLDKLDNIDLNKVPEPEAEKVELNAEEPNNEEVVQESAQLTESQIPATQDLIQPSEAAQQANLQQRQEPEKQEQQKQQQKEEGKGEGEGEGEGKMQYKEEGKIEQNKAG